MGMQELGCPRRKRAEPKAYRTFQIFTSSIQTVFGTRKLNQRFSG